MTKINAHQYLSYFATLLLGFSAFYKVSYGNVAISLILILALLRWRDFYASMARSSYFWLGVFFLAWIVARATLQIVQNPESLGMVGDQILDYLKLIFLPALVTGYLFTQYPKTIPAAFALVPVGLLARVLFDWKERNGYGILQGLDRARFGDSAVNFGFWGVITILIGLYFTHRFFALRTDQKIAKPSLIALGLAITVFGAGCTLYSQTRTAWIVAALLCPAYIGVALFFMVRDRKHLLTAFLILFTATVAFGLALSQSELVTERWSKAQSGIATILSGDWTNIGASSLELRLRMFREAWIAFLQHPFFGHGLGQDAPLLAASSDAEITKRGFSHFHNQWLWLLVETGITGAVLALWGYVILIWHTAKSLLIRRDDLELPTLVLMSLLALFMFSMLNMPITSYRGPFIFALLGGSAIFIGIQQSQRRSADCAFLSRTQEPVAAKH